MIMGSNNYVRGGRTMGGKDCGKEGPYEGKTTVGRKDYKKDHTKEGA
jgi:hypothetical protein